MKIYFYTSLDVASSSMGAQCILQAVILHTIQLERLGK